MLDEKMNDNGGWYLPFIYIDGYIDTHGYGSVERAVDEVVRGVVDPILKDSVGSLIATMRFLEAM